MRRLAPLALVLGFAILGGTARADTFAIVPTPAGDVAAPLAIPDLTANLPGSVALPMDFLTPPAAPAQLSYTELLGLWQRAGSAYGIPWQVLAAINKVESNFGRNMGPSSAGAIGWMQFMPDTWLRWGTDANGDGVADPWNPDDAIVSAARYLAAAGGTTDLYRGVYAYNHADWYVREVLGLAGIYGSDSTVAFSLDRLQQALEAARSAVVAANARLLSDRVALEALAGRAPAAREAAAAAVRSSSEQLAAARAELARAQRESAASSFAPAASQLLAAPSYSSGYVFPVGGGPGVVSASHTHHDYPAVDIAAPLGSPLYALASSVVLRAWSTPDPRCGIGLTLRTFDGQVWTYCHLSVLDASVVAGASLAAGQEVGLVGATGNATGPHLHLQLQPPLEWPQQEAWFQSFAGTAFAWSDAGAEDAPVDSRTFAVVGEAAPALTAGGGPVFQVVPIPTPSDGVVFFSRPGS